MSLKGVNTNRVVCVQDKEQTLIVTAEQGYMQKSTYKGVTFIEKNSRVAVSTTQIIFLNLKYKITLEFAVTSQMTNKALFFTDRYNLKDTNTVPC